MKWNEVELSEMKWNEEKRKKKKIGYLQITWY